MPAVRHQRRPGYEGAGVGGEDVPRVRGLSHLLDLGGEAVAVLHRRGQLAESVGVGLRQGGPSLNISQLLLNGRVDMTMSNGFQALSYVRENIPFLTGETIYVDGGQAVAL